MAGVTVTLTQEESNFVNYIIDQTVISIERNLATMEKSTEANGSHDGRFGERVREADQSLIQVLIESLEIYSDLRDKFPVDNPE